MFYKATLQGEIVDAFDDLQRVMWSVRSRMLLRCTEQGAAEGIISSNGEHIWHVDGWPEFPADVEGIDATVTLAEIDEAEYRVIRAAIDEGQTIPDPEEDEEEEVPVEDEETLAFLKRQRIAYSKKLLAQYLEENPLVSQAHGGATGIYAVTEEKQQLMALNYTTYQIQKAAGIEAVLTWNETGKACEPWTEAEFVQLILEAQQYVKPLVSKQQYMEMEIQSAETTEEVISVEIAF